MIFASNMRLAVVGSRTFSDTKLAHKILDEYKSLISQIVSGGAAGADTIGEKWAKSNNISTNIIYPEWDKYGKRAGYIRNMLIVDASDAILAFWDGKSKGTKHTIDYAMKLGKAVRIIEYET